MIPPIVLLTQLDPSCITHESSHGILNPRRPPTDPRISDVERLRSGRIASRNLPRV